jgi:hypothetical protein
VVKIAYSRSCANTAAFALLVEGWNELVQDGVTPDGLAVCPVTADCECVYAYEQNDDILGAVAFRYVRELDALEVVLAYVEPSSRKRGVFTALLADLKARFQETVSQIIVSVPAANGTGLAAVQKLGVMTETKFCLWKSA